MKEGAIQVLKAVCAAVVLSLVYVLAFTLIIQLFSLEGGIIKPVNQVFKVICLAACCLAFLRGPGGLAKGAVAGGLAVVATYLLFGAMGGSLAFTLMTLAELAIGCVAGGIAGIIAANIKKI